MSAALAGACLVMPAGPASAQAFLPPSGDANVTISYQNARADGHLDLNGDRMTGESAHDPTQTHAMTWGFELGLSHRLAVSASLPFMASKYGGHTPHLVGGTGTIQVWDDGMYHATFQDFQIGVRVNVRARPVSITPFAEATVPSHHYPSAAHAAPGKDLRALAVGVAVGGFLDRLAPGVYAQAEISHTVSQAEVSRTVSQDDLNIRPNHTRVDAELGYFVTPRVSVRFVETFRVTHDGLDLIAFASPMTVARIHSQPDVQITGRNHDRLQRSDYLNLGGGVDVAVNESLTLFAAAAKTVWGKNIHPLRALTVGANLHFRTRR